MFKFLRITLSGVPHLIPVDKIIGVMEQHDGAIS
jgi:hypothetical protein